MRKTTKVKKKKINTRGRRNSDLSEVVNMITRDSLVTLEELMGAETEKEADAVAERDEKGRVIAEKSTLPEGTTAVDTLNGCFVYKDERLKRHIDTMKLVLKEFKSDFFEKENGETIMDLRRDKKDRVWGDDITILNLVYTSIAMGLARYTYTRPEWPILEHGMPYIRFTFQLEPGENKNE